MRQFAVILVLFQLTAIFAWLYKDDHRDRSFVDKSGVVVRANTPENSVKSFYELLGRESYDTAASLQTAASAKIMNAALLKETFDNTRVSGARLAEVYPAVTKGELAVVGSVRAIRFPGNSIDSYILSEAVLKYNPDAKKWELISNLTEVEQEHFLALLDLIEQADKEIKNYVEKESILGAADKKSLQEQVTGMTNFHRYQKDEFEKALAKLKEEKTLASKKR